jgi:hypothetical protein
LPHSSQMLCISISNHGLDVSKPKMN